MTPTKRGKYWYGEQLADVQAELVRYSRQQGYPATAFRSLACRCGGTLFQLASDENEGVARRTCAACGHAHVMADGAEYLAEATLEDHECACGSLHLELMVGVALYADSADVRWLYIGGHCPRCNLVGCFADWKNECPGCEVLLDNC